MELEQAIYTRRSIRKYSDRPVEKAIIEKIIEAGTWAPSACNIQGWRFIVLDDKKTMNMIVDHGAATFLRNVNQAILVLYDNQTDNLEYSDYIQSASACIENMLLMAHSLSVGACWVNFLPGKAQLRQLLQIPSCFDPIALVSLGYYEQDIHPRPRKNQTEDLIYWNRFEGLPIHQRRKYKLFIKRILRKGYFLLPVSWKRKAGKLLNKREKKFNN